jgi:ParB-like chromosome segregation protein Spo0J
MRVDVHPYEEAEGFERLLDVPGYDVATLAEKTGKSASHIYARLSLLQLIPAVAEAFTQERITLSHANLIARLPQESQCAAFEQCWRRDWKDNEAHLLPAKFLAAWIQNNLYLPLADVAALIVGDEENNQQTADEVLASAIAALPNDKLAGFALRLVLTAYTAIPRDGAVDYLAEVESAFALTQSKTARKSKNRAIDTKSSARKSKSKKKAAA